MSTNRIYKDFRVIGQQRMWKGVMDLHFLKWERRASQSGERAWIRAWLWERTGSLTPDIESTGQSEQEGHCRCMRNWLTWSQRLPRCQPNPCSFCFWGDRVHGDLGVGEERPRRISVTRGGDNQRMNWDFNLEIEKQKSSILNQENEIKKWWVTAKILDA